MILSTIVTPMGIKFLPESWMRFFFRENAKRNAIVSRIYSILYDGTRIKLDN